MRQPRDVDSGLRGARQCIWGVTSLQELLAIWRVKFICPVWLGFRRGNRGKRLVKG